jgi:hypothetical protein
LFLGRWRIEKPFIISKAPPDLAPGQDETAVELLWEYVDEEFTKPVPEAQSHEYMLSAAFAACYARGPRDPFTPQLDLPLGCIEYRSAVPLAPGYNLAIHPKVAEDALSLIDVVELLITEVRDDWIGWTQMFERGYPSGDLTDGLLAQALEWRIPANPDNL